MADHFLNLLLSSLLYAEPPDGGNQTSFHWSYKGTTGPNYWGSHYRACSGTRQSPVDIKDHNVIYQDLPPFQFSGFDGLQSTFVLRNNGHTASISVSGNMTVEGGGLDGKYNTAEFHFHWGSSDNKFGSEHSINGRRFPLEMHIVNYATKYGSLPNAMRFRDGLAVLGSFFDVGRENVHFRPVEDGLKQARHVGNYTTLKPVNLLELLPNDTSRYYRYYGSLTTPPCHQSVMWTIFEDMNYLSPYQMQLLQELYEQEYEKNEKPNATMFSPLGEILLVDNYRPIQPDFDRVINSNILRYADPKHANASRLVLPKRPASYDILTRSLSKINVEDLFNKTLHIWLKGKGMTITQLNEVLSKENLQLQSEPKDIQQMDRKLNSDMPLEITTTNQFEPGSERPRQDTTRQTILRTTRTTSQPRSGTSQPRSGTTSQPSIREILQPNLGTPRQPSSGKRRQPSSRTLRKPSSRTLRKPSSGTPRKPSLRTLRKPSSRTTRQPSLRTLRKPSSRTLSSGSRKSPPTLTRKPPQRISGSPSLQTPRRPVSTSRRPTGQPSRKKQLPTLSHQLGSKNIQALSGRTAKYNVTKLGRNTAGGNTHRIISQARPSPTSQGQSNSAGVEPDYWSIG